MRQKEDSRVIFFDLFLRQVSQCLRFSWEGRTWHGWGGLMFLVTTSHSEWSYQSWLLVRQEGARK